jgi:long-chain fatty acid transport protein
LQTQVTVWTPYYDNNTKKVRNAGGCYRYRSTSAAGVYRGIEALGYPLLPNLTGSRLGSNDGPGLGLKNMTVFKVGWQWQQSPAWTWRAGVSYGRQPLQKSEVLLNLLVPGVQEFHITTGFSYKASPIDDLSFAFYYSPEHAVKGANSLSPNQTIEIKMYQFGFQCGWTRRF